MSKIKVNEIEKASGSGITIPTGTSLTVTDGIPATNLSGTIADARLPTVPVTKGGTGLTSLGSANQQVRVNSAGNALEFATIAAPSSDYVKILTQTVSSAVASVEFKNGVNGCVFDNTYRNYKIIISEIFGSGNGHFRMRYMSGNTVRNSGYLSAGYRAYYDGSSSGHDLQTANAYHYLLNMNTSTSLSTGSTNAEVSIFNPSNAGNRTSAFSHVSGQDSSSYLINQVAGSVYTVAEATTGIHFYANGNNIAGGTFTLYGIKT